MAGHKRFNDKFRKCNGYGVHALRVMDVINVSARVCGVPKSKLLSHSRTREISRIRYIAYLVGRWAGHSTPQIGKALGRDHSTVIHGIERCCEIMRADPQYRKLVVYIARETKARGFAAIGKIYPGSIVPMRPKLPPIIIPKKDEDFVDDMDLLSARVSAYYGGVAA